MCFINLVQYKYTQLSYTTFEMVTVQWPSYLTNQNNFRIVLNSHAVSLGSMKWGGRGSRGGSQMWCVSLFAEQHRNFKTTSQVRKIQRIAVVGSYPIESYPGSYFQT